MMTQPIINTPVDRDKIIVFISYSGADNPKLVEHLHAKLTSPPTSMEIWWDKKSIQTGEIWTKKIEDGIRRCDILLFLVGARSIQPESIAHREWNFALENGKPVLPILCDPTVNHDQIPFLLKSVSSADFRTYSINNCEHSEHSETLGKLIDAIEKAATSGKAEDTSTKSQRFLEKLSSAGLRPYYDAPITYVGREWLIERIERWVVAEDSANLLIVGSPGDGKTALMHRFEELDRERRQFRVLGAHYCRHLDAAYTQPKEFVQGLVKLFAGKFKRYERYLNDNVDRQNEILGTHARPTFALQHAVLEPLARLTADIDDEFFCIVVDALDEAVPLRLMDGTSDDDTLFDLVKTLVTFRPRPPWLKVIVTARRDNRIVQNFARHERWDLSGTELAERSKDDISYYVKHQLQQLRDMQRVCIDNFKIDAIANRIADAAGCNFTYAEFVLRELKRIAETSGDYNSSHESLTNISLFVDQLSGGLYSKYTESLNRREKSPFFEQGMSVLGVVACAFESLSWPQLQIIAGINRAEIPYVKELLSIYFKEVYFNEIGSRVQKPVRVAFFHKSFFDFLVESQCSNEAQESKSPMHKIDLEGSHLSLARYCARECDRLQSGSDSPEYALRYTALHFLKARDFSSAVFHVQRTEEYLRRRSRRRDEFCDRLASSLPKVKRLLCEGCPSLSEFEDERRRWQEDTNWNKDNALDPVFLSTMLDFYETSLFSAPISIILKFHWDAFASDCFKILCNKDFVVRFVMAKVLAEFSESEQLGQKIKTFVDSLIQLEAESHLQDIPFVFRWEIWAYFNAARISSYQTDSKSEQSFASSLVERPIYIGRMILAEIMLSRVTSAVDEGDVTPFASIFLGKQLNWEYQRLDFAEICSIGKILGVMSQDNQQLIIGEDQARADADVSDLVDRLESVRDASWLTHVPHLNAEGSITLERYFELDAFLNAKEGAFRNRLARSVEHLEDHGLADLFHVLLAHPSWNIREVFATELSSIVKDGTSLAKVERVVKELASSSNWRVVYGANECAFQLRVWNESKLFNEAVAKSTHAPRPNCKIRGNLVENALAIVLEQGSPQRVRKKWREYEPFISATLTKEDDCWSLDILWEYFSEVNDWLDNLEKAKDPEKAKVASEILQTADLAKSPFLGVVEDEEGRKKWYELDRFDFLEHIERVKDSSVSNSGTEGSR